ncbi:hypothetical protein P5704_026910 (plasmid) [Pseudomonas sp. FeN3W]|nr:hypothetical protein P5704_026910 [Pseudomonas sp. FeN3W]
MNTKLDRVGHDEIERFEELVDSKMWDEAKELFISIHKGGENPLVLCHNTRVRLLELSLNRDVNIPSEYLALSTKGHSIRVALKVIKSEMDRDPTISDERALATLDLMAKACSEFHAEKARSSASFAVIKLALEVGFPVDTFRRAGRFHEIKRHMVEVGFGI